MMMFIIKKLFLVASMISPGHNGIHAFETSQARHKNFPPLSGIRWDSDTTVGAPVDRCKTRLPSLALGAFRNNNKDQTGTKDDIDIDIESGYNKGLLVLATVPMAWGTFEPAVRLVYQCEPSMPPLVFSSAYYLVATTVLSIGTLSSADSRSAVSSAGNDPNSLRGASSDETRDSRVDGASLETANNFGAVSGLSLSTRGGIELGTYLFIGNALQVFGLKTVPSDRAAFLLQLTTLFVPLLKSATVKAEIPLVTWLACLVALLGVALIGLDDESAAVDYGGLDSMKNYGDILYNAARLLDRLPSFSVEDGYIVLAAVFYTFHCIRLETYARSTASPIGLATAKATTETLWSGLVIVGCVVAAGARGVESGAGGESTSIVDTARISGETILSYGKVIQQQISSPQAFASGGWPRVGLATLWVGAVTVAYTIYAQSFGQSRVSAVTANLIYSSQPIFTALVAYYLLGESLGINGYIGGMLIGLAVLLVIAAEAETEQLVTMDRADD